MTISAVSECCVVVIVVATGQGRAERERERESTERGKKHTRAVHMNIPVAWSVNNSRLAVRPLFLLIVLLLF